MSERIPKDVISAVPTLAQANRKVLSIVERLAGGAAGVHDEETRSLILGAAEDLLGATNEINDTLAAVAGDASSATKRP